MCLVPPHHAILLALFTCPHSRWAVAHEDRRKEGLATLIPSLSVPTVDEERWAIQSCGQEGKIVTRIGHSRWPDGDQFGIDQDLVRE